MKLGKSAKNAESTDQDTGLSDVLTRHQLRRRNSTSRAHAESPEPSKHKRSQSARRRVPQEATQQYDSNPPRESKAAERAFKGPAEPASGRRSDSVTEELAGAHRHYERIREESAGALNALSRGGPAFVQADASRTPPQPRVMLQPIIVDEHNIAETPGAFDPYLPPEATDSLVPMYYQPPASEVAVAPGDPRYDWRYASEPAQAHFPIATLARFNEPGRGIAQSGARNGKPPMDEHADYFRGGVPSVYAPAPRKLSVVQHLQSRGPK